MTKGKHLVEFEVDAVGNGFVRVDGMELSVSDVEIKAGAGMATKVTVTLVNVEVRGQAAAADDPIADGPAATRMADG